MPVPGRSLLLAAAISGAALGAAPAIGAKHHRARFVAVKARAHGHMPARPAGRTPLTGTLPVTGQTTPTTPTTTDPVPTTPKPACPSAIGVREGNQGTLYYTRPSRSTACPGPIVMELQNE